MNSNKTVTLRLEHDEVEMLKSVLFSVSDMLNRSIRLEVLPGKLVSEAHFDVTTVHELRRLTDFVESLKGAL